MGYSQTMEWWLLIAIAALAIALVVQDNWRAYRHWWPMGDRIRAERSGDEAKRQRLHDLTHRQAASGEVEPDTSLPPRRP